MLFLTQFLNESTQRGKKIITKKKELRLSNVYLFSSKEFEWPLMKYEEASEAELGMMYLHQ